MDKENIVLYRPIFGSREVISIPLQPTGKRIETITSASELMKDPNGVIFFRKQTTDADTESFQLWVLKQAGILTPEVGVAEYENNKSLLTKESGIPLTDFLLTLNAHEAKQILHLTGLKLRQIHDILEIIPLPSERIQVTYQPSAHIIDTFFYKFLLNTPYQISLETYKHYKTNRHEPEIIEQFDFSIPFEQGRGMFIQMKRSHPKHIDKLLLFLNDLADHYLLQLSPYVKRHIKTKNILLQIGDHQLFYGDFKPENILASQAEGQWHLAFIDPVISRGSIYFDIAKFTSRYLLDNLLFDDKRRYIGSFFNGFGTIPLPELKLYGPYTFIDLLTIDRLNIFRSYFYRYDRQDSSYRFVQQIESPTFCQALTDELLSLTNIKNSVSFDKYFFENL